MHAWACTQSEHYSLARDSSCTRLGSGELCAFAQLHTYQQAQGRCMTTAHVTGDDQQREEEGKKKKEKVAARSFTSPT